MEVMCEGPSREDSTNGIGFSRERRRSVRTYVVELLIAAANLKQISGSAIELRL